MSAGNPVAWRHRATVAVRFKSAEAKVLLITAGRRRWQEFVRAPSRQLLGLDGSSSRAERYQQIQHEWATQSSGARARDGIAAIPSAKHDKH